MLVDQERHFDWTCIEYQAGIRGQWIEAGLDASRRGVTWKLWIAAL
jgi:hypothetical protein